MSEQPTTDPASMLRALAAEVRNGGAAYSGVSLHARIMDIADRLSGEPAGIQQAGLPDDPAALKRIVMRHVRWRQEALGLFQRVNPKWPELVEFLEASTARLVAQSVICPNCDTALPEGCRGANADDGEFCWRNRQPPTKAAQCPHGREQDDCIACNYASPENGAGKP